jgi:hypothetical protein
MQIGKEGFVKKRKGLSLCYSRTYESEYKGVIHREGRWSKMFQKFNSSKSLPIPLLDIKVSL